MTPPDSTGLTSAFSSATDTASLFVNDAPVLTPANPSLGTVGNISPTTTSLDAFINNGTGTTTIVDPNQDAVVGGIALIGITGNGTWAYSIDGGQNFIDIDNSLSSASALLLPKDAQLRYTPSDSSETPTITYIAWDTTTGVPGEQVDLSQASSSGGATAFSADSDTATLTVRSAPTDISLDNSTIPDNTAIGSTVGTFSTTAPEGGTFTYALVDGTGSTDNSAFTVDPQTGILKSAITFNAGIKSSYTIRVRTTDQVGLSFEKSFTITLTDVTPPTVTINQQVGQTDPTHSASIYFVVKFTEPVTDFTAADVTLSGTAPGATVKKVTGSGTTYEVQVGGMTGSGSVIATIAAGKAHDAAGNANLASTSTDNTVQYIYNWATYAGTSKDDTFVFSPGTTPGTWLVKVNSTIWVVPASTEGITIDGLGGYDKVTVVGIANNQNLQIWPDHVTLGNFQLNFTNVESVSYSVGYLSCTTASTYQANDTVYMYAAAGSPGTKTFTASPTSAALAMSGYSISAMNFANVQAYIQPGNGDTATFTDSSGNDLFLVSPIGADLMRKGGGYEVSAWGFSNVNATASGGNDEVRFYGKSGATDTFVATSTGATYTNAAFVNKASGFDDVQAYIDPNNNSTATLMGTAGDDRSVTSPLGAQMFATGFQSSAWNFRHINVQSNGGNDSADMYGSSALGLAAADSFTGLPASASFSGSQYDRQVSNFSKVTAHGKAQDTAFFRDTASNPMSYTGNPNMSSAAGAGFNNIAKGFGSVQAYAVLGNGATATFNDSAGLDRYTASSLGASMVGSGFDNSAWNFGNITANSTGGHDVAYLYGSALGTNQLLADSLSANLSNTGFDNSASGFEKVNVYGNGGASDSATLDNAMIDTGLTNRPIDGSPYNHVLFLNNFDELFTTEKPNDSTPTPHAIDQVMSSYWP